MTLFPSRQLYSCSRDGTARVDVLPTPIKIEPGPLMYPKVMVSFALVDLRGVEDNVGAAASFIS